MMRARLATGWMLAIGAVAAPATAQPVGAPQNLAMQPGGWGASGWSTGAAPVATSPAVEPGIGAPPRGSGRAAFNQRDGGFAPDAPAMPMMVRRTDFRPLRPGQKLRGVWLDPSLAVREPGVWGLGRPQPGTHWIRYYDDAVLVDANARVVTERGPIRWDMPPRGARFHGGFTGPHPGFAGPAPTMAPRVRTERVGPGTMVTTRTEPLPPPAVLYAGGGYAPGVVVTPGTVTTTTVTTETVSYRTVRAPARRVASRRRGKLVQRY